jgi:hypothetical protein
MTLRREMDHDPVDARIAVLFPPVSKYFFGLCIVLIEGCVGASKGGLDVSFDMSLGDSGSVSLIISIRKHI